MFYRSIHYLRGIAAVSVVALHASGGPDELQILAGGVDVFFVISGFVMVHVARNDFSPLGFLYRRAMRIYPTYWAACLVTLLFLPVPVGGAEAIRDMLLLPAEREMGDYYIFEPFIGQGWTLVYEMMFYLIFAACLGRWLAASAVLLTLSLLWLVAPSGFTNPVMAEFIFGMAIAATPQHIRQRLAVPALLLGLLGFWSAWYAHGSHSPERVFIIGIPAALVVLGAVGLDRLIPHLTLAHFLGSASYCIYVFHYVGVYGAFGLPWPVIFAAAVGAGCAAYVAIERPLIAPLYSRA